MKVKIKEFNRQTIPAFREQMTYSARSIKENFVVLMTKSAPSPSEAWIRLPCGKPQNVSVRRVKSSTTQNVFAKAVSPRGKGSKFVVCATHADCGGQ